MMKTINLPIPRSLSTDSCNLVAKDQVLIKHSISYDEVDNPGLRKFFTSEQELFRAMKYECNRLYSFKEKWPLKHMKPESLAEAGLFYLQEGDRVQCPFCFVILHHWTALDEPLREHMKRSPRCPFLMASHDCGNVPLSKQERTHSDLFCERRFSPKHVDYKPKNPGMSDIKRRLLTYSGWRRIHPQPQVLAECGFYYTGVADVVTCFFCGGSLGNWESTDDPWDEHAKFYKECAFLSLAACRNTSTPKVNGACETQLTKHKVPMERGPDITTDIVQEALHIFPEPLVRDAINRKGGIVGSLEELCSDIVASQSDENGCASEIPPEKEATNSYNDNVSGPSSTSDALLCKICMDRDREVVFQPCGHLVSCYKCSQRLRDCPACRKPIQHVIRTYVI